MRFDAGDLRELMSLLDARQRAWNPSARQFFENAIMRLMLAFMVADQMRRSVS